MLGLRRSGSARDTTAVELGLGIGLCAVPFAFVVMAWLRGWQAGLASALVVATIVALACWALCRSLGDR